MVMNRWVALLALVCSLGTSGCTKKKPPASAPAESQVVDSNAEQAAADQGWILEIARDSEPLKAMAQSSAGWGAYFSNDLARAVTLFQDDARKNESARIGGARAALALARAYERLAQLQTELIKPFQEAQASRPGAEQTADWRRFISARLDQRLGNGPEARTKLRGLKSPQLAGLAKAAAELAGEAGDGGAAGDLLAGRPGGTDADALEGMSSTYHTRLRIRCLAAVGQPRTAQKLWERLDHRAPDLQVVTGDKTTRFWDPVAADAGQKLYAAIALKLLKGLDGWAPIFVAEAQLHLGQPAAALTVLEALLKAPPTSVKLSETVLSTAFGVQGMTEWAKALRIRALVDSGKVEEAKVLLSQLGRATIAQRVRHAAASAMVGLPVEDVFPVDRGTLSSMVNAQVAQLGAQAKGATDVTELFLVERYVDQVQRQWADILAATDKPARAAREWSMAEDKARAFTISARNGVSSLLASSLAALRIGQYRVSLKYLSRLNESFPAAFGAAEQLRDILSYRAMAREGSVTTGQ